MVKEAGFSPLEAIQAATINAATMMRLDASLGSLDTGKTADLIALSVNPLEDISALRSVPFVVKGGRVVKNELILAT
jgi:imidazolonepropionase-like amidohydrolase